MSAAESDFQVAPWPKVDFSEFGDVESVPLSRIQKITAASLHRNWVTIPHVFHQDEADVTDLEALRQEVSARHPEVKLTTLAFLIRAVAQTLLSQPTFNASVDLAGGRLLQKKYVHVGVAVDTPGGLVVPVIRDCDRKSAPEIAAETQALSSKARSKGLTFKEMSGGCFTVSSLGRAGGTGFSPIINAPEVAILGVSRILERPARGADDAVVWRQVLPLTLSYDHRVNNGAAASKFMSELRGLLERPDRLLP